MEFVKEDRKHILTLNDDIEYEYNDMNFTITYIIDDIFVIVVINDNKIIFGISEDLNFHNIDVYESLQNYFIAIFFVKYKIFKSSNYISYINKNCLNNDNSDFNFIFENKLEILKTQIKDIFIPFGFK